MADAAKKSLFYDFLARYAGGDFDTYLAQSVDGDDYLNWNGYVLRHVFTSEEEEYRAVRSGCALFDATPANKYRITGPGAGPLLDRMTTRSMSRLPPLRATYAIWCNPDGMLNDDAMLFKLADDDYLLMAAEVDHTAYLGELAEQVEASAESLVTVEDQSADWAGLAVQGARSCAVLRSFGFEGIESQRPYEIRTYALDGSPVTVARVGFTGDLGYEIWFDPALAPAVEQAFERAEKALDLTIAGYGLTTIQLCRMESGMIVPGWDTAQTFEDPELERSPFELGLGWNVDLDRPEDFVGKSALLAERAQGSRFVLRGFEIDDECDLLDGTELSATVDGAEIEVGTLPSVSWSHDGERWIGLCSLRTEHEGLAEGFVDLEDGRHSCRLVPLPFLQIGRRRQVPAPL